MKFRYLSLLLLAWCVTGLCQDAQQNPPAQGDAVPQQTPVQADTTAQPESTPPPQGGDFSTNLDAEKVPAGVILVKGAWASASDSITPLPEGGGIHENVYKNDYFGLSYTVPADWYQQYAGPPPSDSASYVLLQLRPTDAFKGPAKGTILFSAQDMFFSLTPAKNALEMVKYSAGSLRSSQVLEKAPAEVTIAGHSFASMSYLSPVAGLHWQVLSTQIRCHALEFVFVSRDTALLSSLIKTLDKIKLPDEAGDTAGNGGGNVPVCIKNYAKSENVLNRVEPVLPEHKYNPIPVRIIIGKNGKVTHVHMISAEPDQAKIVTDALLQWEFKPYLINGEPVQVETGIMFGLSATPSRKAAGKRSNPIAD